jgi:hypothetical protein
MEERHMQSNINFFGWIREGVKQSVLLGVSDAIETIGTPDDPQTIHPQVAALMSSSGKGSLGMAATGHSPRIQSEGGSQSTQKRRLGRSLKDIETPS